MLMKSADDVNSRKQKIEYTYRLETWARGVINVSYSDWEKREADASGIN